MFPIVVVDSDRAQALEHLGTKKKFWFWEAEDGPRYLFKAEERGTGEDWAEKLAAEFAALLGLPHVSYKLAHDLRQDVPGVVCETCTPGPIALKHGNQLLATHDADYPEGSRWHVRQHTVDAVAGVLERLDPPPVPWCDAFPAGIETAMDIFVGYVMLDAWIANQDRHHENWAAMRDGDALYLAPTFDHGASMARNVGDDERRDRLTTKDHNRTVERFAARARSAFFVDPKQKKAMLTLEAWLAFARLAPKAAKIWCSALERIIPEMVDGLIAEVPPKRMSPVCRDFTSRLLEINRQRILDQGLT